MINLNDYIKYKLDNGLQVILYKDSNFPLVTVNLWYRVGSANEKIGKTGLAHLSEHLMFQGSENVPKEAHFKYIEEAGGTLNGSTDKDRTNYYETLPSNHLELGLWLESDRMGYLVSALDQAKFDNQLNVVINERKERYDNEPYGRAFEIIYSSIYPENHPYHAPVIGWQKDLDVLTIDDAKNFLKTFYSPNNASLVVAGDFEIEEAKELIEKYFGEFEASEIPEIEFPEVAINENKEVIYYDKVKLPRVYFVWSIDKVFSDEATALNLASSILSMSKTKHFYKKLVYDEQSAISVSAMVLNRKEKGLFVISATAQDGRNLDEIKKSIFEVIETLKQNKFDEEELKRFLNSYSSETIYSLQNLANIANGFNTYDFYLGEPNGFNFELEKYRKLTPETVTEYAINCLEKPYLELRILPKEETNGNK